MKEIQSELFEIIKPFSFDQNNNDSTQCHENNFKNLINEIIKNQHEKIINLENK